MSAVIIQEKAASSTLGKVFLTIFLLMALFGVAFSLSLVVFNKKVTPTTADEVVPEAEIKLPLSSPTPTPLPSPVPTSKARVAEGCKLGGCNYEICLGVNDEVASSVCQYHEKYACYQNAICETQKDGKCDWTKTQALTTCITKADKKENEILFCGGIAALPCPDRYTCQLDGDFPDAGGKCIKSD